MVDNHVFICGAHKSGSSLLRSLFYAHPEVGVVPIESHSPILFGCPSINPMRSQIGHQRGAQTEKKIRTHIQSYFESKSKLSDAKILTGEKEQLFSEIDKIKFNYSDTSLNDFYKILINHLSHQDSGFNTILEKSVTNSEQAMNLKSIFPKAKFIHIIRNPYSNLVSLRKYNTSINKGPFLQKLMELLRLDYYFLQKNRLLLNGSYFTVRYEDLVKDTRKVLEKIFHHIQLPFREECLYPRNAVGDTWRGNSTRNKSYSSVSSKDLDAWMKEIHPLEVRLCNQVLDGYMKREGYSLLQSQKSSWKRFPHESISRYFYNRTSLKALKYWRL